MADEEGVDEAQPAATEFVPEASGKPKSNVYTTLLILTFCAFFAGSWVAGNEAWQHYDVQFFGIFTKHPKANPSGPESNAPTGTNTGTGTGQDASKDAPAPKPPDGK